MKCHLKLHIDITLHYIQQVCVQLPTSADNVALPAFAAARRAAARLLLTAGPPCSNRFISLGRRAHSSKPTAAVRGGRMGQTDGRTDGRRTDAQTYSAYYADSDKQSDAVVIIPAKAFARDYVITGVRLSVCLSVCYHYN